MEANVYNVDTEHVAQAICCVFQGDLNPVVVANELSSKVLYQSNRATTMTAIRSALQLYNSAEERNTHNEL